jgi:hypothetical protein
VALTVRLVVRPWKLRVEPFLRKQRKLVAWLVQSVPALAAMIPMVFLLYQVAVRYGQGLLPIEALSILGFFIIFCNPDRPLYWIVAGSLAVSLTMFFFLWMYLSLSNLIPF